MLELLRIKNLALIEDAELEFAPGLNVLTGETGAGKSFIMRAVDFIMGERMDVKLVRAGAEKATVEALFILDSGETVIRRELSAETGRSRVYVNDVLSSQAAVKDMRSQLVIHTSQHGQQKLLSPAFQAEILDSFLPDHALIQARDKALAELQDILARKQAIMDKSAALEKQREFMEFQLKEIAKVGPEPGEEDRLEERKQVLKEREKSGECLQNALGCIHGDVDMLDVLNLLSREMGILARLYPEFDEYHESVEEFRLRLHDLDSRLRRGPEEQDEDTGGLSLDALESRLFELAQLKRKLRRGLDEIVDLQAEVAEALSFLDACGLDLKNLAKEEAVAAKALGEALKTLNDARKKTARELAIRIQDELMDLGFSEHVKVRFEFEPRELYPGLDELRGRLLWIPNPGQAPQPLDKIASGGELSRFLLALVTLKGIDSDEPDSLPSLIFDEVDAGIGGMTLNAVGAKLRTLADKQQMLLVTHWPQLAGMADRHFAITKDVTDSETHTRCRRLDKTEIRDELCRMAGGGEQGRAVADSLCK